MVRRGRVLLLVVAGLVVLAVGGVVVYLSPIAPIATGYAAKITCSGHHVSGRPVAEVQGDLPDNPLVPYLRTDVTEDRVRATLLGAWGSTAWYTPGHGCTLAEERPALPALEPAQRERSEPSDAPWPAGDGGAVADPDGVDLQVLESALDAAFSEEDLADDPEGRRRGTRAVAIVHEGRLIAERYADGFDADTALLGWSMGKSIANAIVGRIAHTQGGDIDAFVARRDLRPEWCADERAEITLHHLLTMTDGLEFEEVYDPDTDATRMLFTPRDTGAYAAAKPLVADAGARYAYSSGTTNILCDVAHDTSGMGPEMARELLFAPLGMAQRGPGARRLRRPRLLVVHLRHGTRLGPLRAAVPGRRRLGGGAAPPRGLGRVLHHARRRGGHRGRLRRAVVAERPRRRHPADPERARGRLLGVRERGPAGRGRPVRRAGRRAARPQRLHRHRLGPRAAAARRPGRGRRLLGHGTSSTFPVVSRPSSRRWATGASSSGCVSPMRTSSSPSRTQPNRSRARCSSSARSAL
jgi:CubicO group peptidase (beta-lactamase class C family)